MNKLTCGSLRLRFRHHQHFDAAGRVLLVEDLLGGLPELLRLGVGNIGEGLRIAVGERKPRALHLDHDAMAAAEGVEEIGHGEVDFGLLARRQRLGLLPTIAELGAEGFAAQQLLIAAHVQRRRVQNALVAAARVLRVGIVFRINVDQLDVEIGVRAGTGDL